jgi:hypothetical protein
MIAAAIADSAQAAGSSEPGAAAIVALLSAEAVRTRCRIVHDWVAEGRSPHFVIEPKRLEAVADAVAQVTREAYPDLRIPYHSRWRHFDVGGGDRWQALAAQLPADPLERARAAIDLATASVLLDAGAGAAWRYRDAPSGLGFHEDAHLLVHRFSEQNFVRGVGHGCWTGIRRYSRRISGGRQGRLCGA